MERNYEQFVTMLYKAISDLNRYHPNDGCTSFLNAFSNLDMGKVLFRYYHIMNAYKTAIDNKDESLFTTPLIIFPGIDLSEHWSTLTSGQKKKMWIHLQLLLLLSEMIITSGPDEANEADKTLANVPDATKKESIGPEFNPYIGVGGDVGEYSVNEMFSGHESLPETADMPNLGSLAGAVGLNKMFNINDLKEELKNMDPSQIDEAATTLTGLMGNNVDDSSKQVIANMISKIADKLQNDEMNSDNPMEALQQIAEGVAVAMQPEMESVDMTNLINSTQQLMGAEGSPFNGFNPFQFVDQMMQNGPPTGQSEEDVMSNMMQQMGMDPNAVDFNALNAMMNNMNKPSYGKK